MYCKCCVFIIWLAAELKRLAVFVFLIKSQNQPATHYVFVALWIALELALHIVSYIVFFHGLFLPISWKSALSFSLASAAKCQEILTHPNAHFELGVYPSAKGMVELAQQKFTE